MRSALRVWATLGSAIFLFTAAGSVSAQEVSDAPISTAPPMATETIWSDALSVTEVMESSTPVEIGEPVLPPRYEPDGRQCEPLAEFGLEQGRMVERLGFDVADGEPTAHGKHHWTCGMFIAGVEFAAVISPNPNRGARRLGDEVRFDFMVQPEFATRIGRFRPKGGTAYMFQDNSEGLFSISDDYTELMVGLDHVFMVRQFEIETTVELVKPNPVNFVNSLAFVHNSAKVTGPLPGENWFSFELAQWHNVNSLYATPHRNVTLGTLELVRPLGDRGWMSVFTITASQYGKRDKQHTPLVERDGRVLLIKRQEPTPGLWLVPHIKFSLRWQPGFRWSR